MSEPAPASEPAPVSEPAPMSEPAPVNEPITASGQTTTTGLEATMSQSQTTTAPTNLIGTTFLGQINPLKNITEGVYIMKQKSPWANWGIATLSASEKKSVQSSTISAEAQSLSESQAESADIVLQTQAISSNMITLKWSILKGKAKGSSSGYTGFRLYHIYRDGIHIATTTSTLFADRDLASSTTYTYKIVVNATTGNVIEESAPITVTTH
jgi:hypothetical protein